MPDKKRPGKLQHCEKLVDIWLIFDQVEKLKGMGNGRGARSTNLSYFIETMTKLALLADEKMREDLDRLKIFKSEPKPPGESERLYLEGGGSALNMTEYPCCPNPRCGHTLIDQPPGNATVQADNARAATAYVDLSQAYSKWKKKLGPQPICQETGELMDKPPKAPKTLTSMLRCHCSQNGVDARRGKKCAVNCTIGGTKYSLGQCPM